MRDQELGAVNAEEGFLPKFSKKFVEHYGADSMFVRTLSDCYTNALVKVLDLNGMRYNSRNVARFSNQAATELLSEWIRSVDGAKELALQEAMGVKPIGSLKVLVDKTIGYGEFQQWLTLLQKKK